MQLCICRNLFRRLEHRSFVRCHKAGLNSSLRLRTTFKQAAVDKESVGTLTRFGHRLTRLSKEQSSVYDGYNHCPTTVATGVMVCLRSTCMARRYSRGASRYVERAMKKRKKGTLRSGRSGRKVRSRKQAIAIGLSEARSKGKKVPRKSRL